MKINYTFVSMEFERELLRLQGLDPVKYKIRIYETNIKDNSGRCKIRTNTFNREIFEFEDNSEEYQLDGEHFNSNTSLHVKKFLESQLPSIVPHLYAILLYCLLNYQIDEPATVSLLQEKQIFSNWKDATIFISKYFLPYFEDNIQQRLILYAKQLKWRLKFGEKCKVLTKKQIRYNYYYRKYFNKSVNMMGYVWTAFSDKVYHEISLINAKDFGKVSFKMLIQPSSIYCMDVIILESKKCANAKERSLTVTSRIFLNFWGYRSLSYLYGINTDNYFTQNNKYLKATNNKQQFEQLRVIVRRARTMLFRWVCSY